MFKRLPWTGPKLYDASGGLLRGGPQPDRHQSDQLVAFVQEQPLMAALAALVLGYFLGKIT